MTKLVSERSLTSISQLPGKNTTPTLCVQDLEVPVGDRINMEGGLMPRLIPGTRLGLKHKVVNFVMGYRQYSVLKTASLAAMFMENTMPIKGLKQALEKKHANQHPDAKDSKDDDKAKKKPTTPVVAAKPVKKVSGRGR